MVISRDVIFDEKSMLQGTQEKEKQVSENYSGNEQVVQVELESHVDEDSVQETGSSSSGIHEHHSIASNRPRRTIKPPTRYGFEDLVSYAFITSSGDPTTFQEAIHSLEKSKWMSAMVEEMKSLHKNQT